MEKNVGGFDKIVRIILGVAIIIAGIVFNSWWGLIGIIPLATGLFGRCCLYCPLGINTCKIDQNNNKDK